MWDTALYVILMLVSVAFASFTSYDSERERSARGALGIILLASLVVPMTNLVQSISSELRYSEEYAYDDVLSSALKQSVEDGIKKAVADEFSIYENDISIVCVDFDKDSLKSEKIKVILSGRASLSDASAIEKYVTDMELGCCETEVNFEKNN